MWTEHWRQGHYIVVLPKHILTPLQDIMHPSNLIYFRTKTLESSINKKLHSRTIILEIAQPCGALIREYLRGNIYDLNNQLKNALEMRK